MTDTSRHLTDLNPLFQPIAAEILELAQNRVAAKFSSSIVRPSVTFRSVSDQAAAKSAGKSKVSLGWHQFGLALDVAVINAEGVYVSDGRDERYRIFGMAAMEHGAIWGGNWPNFPDPGHCEYHPNFTLAQYLAWLDDHRVALA